MVFLGKNGDDGIGAGPGPHDRQPPEQTPGVQGP
jgi:hypothetical protein